MARDLDRQLLSEQYTNSIIKRHIVNLLKEGKSKKEIEQILSEAGFFNNLVQGAKNAYQNYWQDPRAIKAGQKAGYGAKGQAARQAGQVAYNRQTTRKFEKQIGSTLKSLDKTLDKSTQALNKTIYQTINKLFGTIKEEGQNVDPNFLIKQFELVYNSLNAGMARTTGAIQKNYNNILNQVKAMSNSMSGGMQQPQQQQAAPQQPQQAAPPQTPPPAAGTPRNNLAGAYNNQNVAGAYAQPNAQINASTEVKMHKKDFVMLESLYEQVRNNNK
jgi:hypothetical protein